MANLINHATGGNLTTFFSNDGVLTNHFALFAPIQARVWSLLFAFSRPGEVAVAFAAILVVYTLYTIGWRTRVMQVLAVIYGFNAANKSGETWRDGAAVHYILWLNSRNTWLAGVMRAHEPAWFSPLLTRGTLAFEWSAPFLALCPVWQTPLRRLLILGMWSLHLGIASLMTLGPFAYAMLTFSLLLLGEDDWRILEAKFRTLRSFGAQKLRNRPALGRSVARLTPFWSYLLARGRARALADESDSTAAPVARARPRWQWFALEARELAAVFLAGLMF